MKYFLTLLVTFFLCGTSLAEPPRIYAGDTGEYLGTLSADPYAADSVSNPYGEYGSEYNQNSINNPYGPYGSEYSNTSVNNPYATNPPIIVGD